VARALLSLLIGGCAGAAVTSLLLPDLFRQTPAVASSVASSKSAIAVTAANSSAMLVPLADTQATASAGSVAADPAERSAADASAKALPALESLLATTDPNADSLMWDRVALAAVVASPLDALAAARTARHDLAYVRLFELWATIDPESVLAHVSSSDWVDAIGTGVLHQLAAFDPEAVLELVRQPGLSEQNRDNAMRAVGREMAARDLSYAESFAVGLEPGSERDSLLSAVAVRYASEYPDAAWDWLKSVSPSPGNGVINNLLPNLVEDNPQQAIDILLDPTGPWGPSPRFSYLSPLLFLADNYQLFVDSFFAGDAIIRDTLGKFTLSSWASQSPDDAARWARASLQRPDADLIVTTVAAQFARTDPDAAVSLVSALRGRPAFQPVLLEVTARIESDTEYARVRAALAAQGVTLPARP
jgi:hypothetical protein